VEIGHGLSPQAFEKGMLWKTQEEFLVPEQAVSEINRAVVKSRDAVSCPFGGTV
jgi:hypothetical protein